MEIVLLAVIVVIGSAIILYRDESKKTRRDSEDSIHPAHQQILTLLDSPEYIAKTRCLKANLDRAASFSLSGVFAKYEEFPDGATTVTGFAVRESAVGPCSASCAVVAVTGTWTVYKYTGEAGLELLEKGQRILYFDIDHGCFCKPVYDDKGILNVPDERMIAAIRDHPNRVRMPCVGCTRYEPVGESKDQVALFLRYEQAYAAISRRHAAEMSERARHRRRHVDQILNDAEDGEGSV